MMYEESGRRVNVGLMRPLLRFFKGILLRLLGCDTTVL
jgi:hypothetical protein